MVRQRRDFPSVPFHPPAYKEPLPAGSALQAGPEKALLALTPWVTFPRTDTWRRVLPRHLLGGTWCPALGKPWCRGRESWRRLQRAPGPLPGRSQAGRSRGRRLAGRSCGSSPLGGPSRPLAGRANPHDPMTTRPDPSRPGLRDTAARQPEAASLLSPPQQQPELADPTETLAHHRVPQRPAPPQDGT